MSVPAGWLLNILPVLLGILTIFFAVLALLGKKTRVAVAVGVVGASGSLLAEYMYRAS